MRVSGYCFPTAIWPELDSTDNQTVHWKGYGVYIMLAIAQLMGIPNNGSLEVITEFTESDVSRDPQIVPVAEGDVDFSVVDSIMNSK